MMAFGDPQSSHFFLHKEKQRENKDICFINKCVSIVQ